MLMAPTGYGRGGLLWVPGSDQRGMGGTGAWPTARHLPSPAVPSSPVESVLVSVYVQLDFLNDIWPTTLSSTLTLAPALASSSPRTLTGLSLTTGREKILLTPDFQCHPLHVKGTQTEGTGASSPPAASWPEMLPASPYFLEGLHGPVPSSPLHWRHPFPPAPCSHLLNRGPKGQTTGAQTCPPPPRCLCPA